MSERNQQLRKIRSNYTRKDVTNGYDICEIVKTEYNEREKKYLCYKCNFLARDPVFCVNSRCDKCCCKKCFEKIKEPECPCFEAVFYHNITNMTKDDQYNMEQKIKDYKTIYVKCKYYKNNCQVEGSVLIMNEHEKTCDKKGLNTCISCEKSVCDSELERHLTECKTYSGKPKPLSQREINEEVEQRLADYKKEIESFKSTLQQLTEKKIELEDIILNLRNEKKSLENLSSDKEKAEDKPNLENDEIAEKEQQVPISFKIPRKIQIPEIYTSLEAKKILDLYLEKIINMDIVALDFSNMNKGDELINDLIKSPKIEKCRKLKLNGNELTVAAIQTMKSNEDKFKSLLYLNLCNNKLDDSALEVLFSCSFMLQLKGLNIAKNEFTPEVLKNLQPILENKELKLEFILTSDGKGEELKDFKAFKNINEYLLSGNVNEEQPSN